jgi:hypothetical protein
MNIQLSISTLHSDGPVQAFFEKWAERMGVTTANPTCQLRPNKNYITGSNFTSAHSYFTQITSIIQDVSFNAGTEH